MKDRIREDRVRPLDFVGNYSFVRSGPKDLQAFRAIASISLIPFHRTADSDEDYGPPERGDLKHAAPDDGGHTLIAEHTAASSRPPSLEDLSTRAKDG
jgi:hypothetical protein